MTRLQEISGQIRQQGNTTWYLKSAMCNPDVVIVSKNINESKNVECEYYKLLSKSSWI